MPANDMSFLDEEFMETDLESKAVPGGREYQLKLSDVNFSYEKEDEGKKTDSSGHEFAMAYFDIVGGEIPDELEGEDLKRVSKYYRIPDLDNDNAAEVKGSMRGWQYLLKALDFDPGMTPREMIESKFAFMKDLAETEPTCWALLDYSDDPQYGPQNSISRFK